MQFVDEATYLAARLEVLQAEKELSKAKAALAVKRAALPAVALTKAYTLVDTAGADVSFASLFSDGVEEVLVYHLMYDESDATTCSLCCFFIDQFDGCAVHLPPKTKLIVVAKASATQLTALKATKGWKLPVYSAGSSTFCEDMQVSFTSDQQERKCCTYNFNRTWDYGPNAPGMSVFRRQGDNVCKTYQTFAGGLGDVSLVHSLLDLTPSGRDEKDKGNMWWVKHKEAY